MFKRYSAFFLLIIFLANSAGFTLLTFAGLQTHRYAQQNEAHEEKPVVLRIPLAEINSPSSSFQWIEENECEFDGHRYDVISSRTENNLLVMECYDDAAEDFFLQKLKENSSDENSFPAKNKFPSLKKGVEYDHHVFLLGFALTGTSADQLTITDLMTSAVFRPVASPPPRMI